MIIAVLENSDDVSQVWFIDTSKATTEDSLKYTARVNQIIKAIANEDQDYDDSITQDESLAYGRLAWDEMNVILPAVVEDSITLYIE